jgi:uncharacterized YccA/Bax inhibitor family protein
MALFQSGNPALSEKKFSSTVISDVLTMDTSLTMTVKGTLNKFGILFLLTMASAFFTWKEFASGGNVNTLVIGGAIGGLVLGLVMSFKQVWSPFLAPIYALLEGLFLGGVSAFFEFGATSTNTPGFYSGGYSGIVMQAILLTFSVVAGMYLLYKFNIIRATAKFKAIVVTATVGLGIFYLIMFVASFFNVQMPGFLYQGSAMGIGFSVFVVALAAMNLILDFDMIEKGAEMGAPKYMEWYGAFGLLVTIVWLYMEILRLLSKLNRR